MQQEPAIKPAFQRSFALFDADGRLVEWDAGFQGEFGSVEPLIAPGVAFCDLLGWGYERDGVVRGDRPEGAPALPLQSWTHEPPVVDRDHVFEYRDEHDRVIRVNRSRTTSGGLVRTARDVTAWRKSDAVLGDADERWCTDGDPRGEAVAEFTIHADGTMTHAPSGEDVRRLWGLSEDFQIADTAALFSRIVQSPAEAEAQNASIADLAATLKPHFFDVRVRGSDDRLRWINWACTAVREADGSTRISCRLRDVTREKLAEDQLELLRSAVTHATDALQILHTNADRTSVTVYANPAFEALTGWSAEDLLGHTIPAPDPSDRTSLAVLLGMAERNDESRVEVQSSHRDGTPLWLEASAKVVERRPDGSFRWVLVSRNIDERKRAEEELRRARDEADQANKSKSEFLANMSHEIRTPMNGVIGMNALLLRTELTPAQVKYAENVRVSADCLLGIINDILDVSKLEAGKVELEEIDFSLQVVVEDVVELLSTRAQEKSLEIASFVDDGARAPLRGDPARLRQILLNLLSNALKFTERGFVSVEVSSETRSDDRTALRLEVHDTGIGLSQEAKSKLFQKFQQADGSITRRFGGTGLGLSICRQLVELMGGEIGVVDRRGGGSTFWFEINLANGQADQRRPHHGRSDLHDVRVLIVDDIELNRNIFARQLEAEGAIITEACGGPECLEAMRRAEASGKPFDIVLLDHMMPGMAGDDVAERIRAEARWAQPKLVLASSIGAPLSTDRAANVGFDAFLTKPVRHQALVDCLAGLIDEAPAAVETHAEPLAPVPAAHGRGAILLAEDNEINTLLAATLLEEAGYHVTCVTNGLEAVEAVSDWTFDLILMDVQMPVMDGLRATRMIRALGGKAAQTPIVAMTANAMASDRDDCIDAGMDDFVSKPIDVDQFLRVVSHFVAADEPAHTAGGQDVADHTLNLPDVDVDHLDGLARLLPAARFKAMLEVYLIGAQGRMDRIEACAQDMDLTALAGEAHDLKSTSGNFGARRLQYLAERLEAACKADDTATVSLLVPAIREASTVAWETIRGRMASIEVEPSATARKAS